MNLLNQPAMTIEKQNEINRLWAYQKAAKQTAVYPAYDVPVDFPARNNPHYLVLKLVGEALEYEQARGLENAEKELGDVMWYIAMLCNEMDLGLAALLDDGRKIRSPRYTSLLRTATTICEPFGKMIRDGCSEKQWLAFHEGLALTFAAVEEQASKIGSNLEKVLEINQEKLRKRQESGTIHGSGDKR